MITKDVIVLGAGMVGIGTAAHLVSRGASVALVDRGAPAGETSFGNAGLIQAEAVVPYTFPHSARVIFGVLAGTRNDARIDLAALPSHARRWFAFFRNGTPSAIRRTTDAMVPLIKAALPEHKNLAERADVSHLLRPGGYLRIFRDPADLDSASAEAEKVAQEFDIPTARLSAAELAEAEPHLATDLIGAIHYLEPHSVPDPADLGQSYASHFTAAGGTLLQGDARTLTRTGERWTVTTAKGPVSAKDVVIALGPWSADLLAAHGINVPLFVKRGYHTHRQAAGNAVLNHLVVDEDNGIVLAPQRRGIRITTGAEFTHRDAPSGSAQLRAAMPVAQSLFPLDDTPGTSPWRGARPCLPDLLPMIGAVDGAPGLWANFGHQHLGFTLGPATGRLLAEAMTGSAPFTALSPYAINRFAR
ncbi:MAG: FAD-binding oxidoreductase [Pseudomonadota bacterium]